MSLMLLMSLCLLGLLLWCWRLKLIVQFSLESLKDPIQVVVPTKVSPDVYEVLFLVTVGLNSLGPVCEGVENAVFNGNAEMAVPV